VDGAAFSANGLVLEETLSYDRWAEIVVYRAKPGA
jgi:hypothetical protein